MRGTLTISLGVIQNNYRALTKKAPGALCAAVVKANAYGLGLAPIAPALFTTGARDFFVALVEEGIELRALLPEANIYVLNGLMQGEEKMFAEYNLVPVLNDAGQARLWNNDLPCALHVDTGLNRLGFNLGEFEKTDFGHLNVDLVMSHLACADMHDHPMNAQQRQRFIAATQKLPGVKKSLAASDGIYCGDDFHFDMIRPGAAIYGVNPMPGNPNPMQESLRLSVPILQIRAAEEDGTVGYGVSCPVQKSQLLATVALGYADGFMRTLSNKGKLFYDDIALPILGRVSMDVVTVDISALKNAALKPGDFLQVLGPQQRPDDLAKDMGTIGYEVLTALGWRFTRVYSS
ncbi:MAG: hypothetical protein JWM96_498 [Alphaproteobacteria bacterium]|nr:hypothetical protein [Alphaproteobacteria bacterium]